MEKGTRDLRWLRHWLAEVGPPYAWTGALMTAIPEAIRAPLRDAWDACTAPERTDLLEAHRGKPIRPLRRLLANGAPVRLTMRVAP